MKKTQLKLSGTGFITTLAGAALLFAFQETGRSQANTPQTKAGAVKVILAGDSIMRAVAHATERQLKQLPGYKVTSFSSLGSGLARLDAFDWHKKIDSLTKSNDVDFLVMMIGTNDKQALQVGNKTIQPDSSDWSVEYAKRIGTAMDIMASNNVKVVLWMELPDMREKKIQADVSEINALAKTQAETRKNVSFIHCKQILGLKVGEYSSYLLKPDGMPLNVRDTDGVHLNGDGATILGKYIIQEIQKRQ